MAPEEIFSQLCLWMPVNFCLQVQSYSYTFCLYFILQYFYLSGSGSAFRLRIRICKVAEYGFKLDPDLYTTLGMFYGLPWGARLAGWWRVRDGSWPGPCGPGCWWSWWWWWPTGASCARQGLPGCDSSPPPLPWPPPSPPPCSRTRGTRSCLD